MIEVNNLVKRYGDHTAVDNLTFSVKKGQILGFLGPNGAGKSTTMNMITGYLSITEGTIKINGYDILQEPEKAKQSIGYLPEVPPLYLDMKVKEYLSFVADIKKVKKEEKKKMISEIMERTRISEVAERLIKHLSKGFRQRVGLAGAIMGYPEVILLDEPTVGLDPAQIIEIRDLIKELSKEHTIILSSHILSEISAVCDSVMIISKGKLVASDTPDNLATHLEGTQGIHLKIKGQQEKIQDILASIEGIGQIKVEDKQEELVSFVVYSSKEGIREEIFYRCAKEFCPIYEMSGVNRSLEEVFLEVTKGDNKEEMEHDSSI